MTRFRTDQAEEAGPAMFQPDTVLPDQYFAAIRQKGFVQGEKRLMAAVLTDAVECYMKQLAASDPRGRQLFADAETWLFGEAGGQGAQWVFSFENICSILGLEPEYVRRGLLAWRRRRFPARPQVVSLRGSEDEEIPLKAAG